MASGTKKPRCCHVPNYIRRIRFRFLRYLVRDINRDNKVGISQHIPVLKEQMMYMAIGNCEMTCRGEDRRVSLTESSEKYMTGLGELEDILGEFLQININL